MVYNFFLYNIYIIYKLVNTRVLYNYSFPLVPLGIIPQKSGIVGETPYQVWNSAQEKDFRERPKCPEANFG